MKQLIDKIVNCKNIAEYYVSTNVKNSCVRIVSCQGVEEKDFQVPEPWNGNLESAPILFVSSNPSISKIEVYPTKSWVEDDIYDFFINRFEGKWVNNNKGLLKDGTYSKNTTDYWDKITVIASILLNKNKELIDSIFLSKDKNEYKILVNILLKSEYKALIGRDFALTEIVHCKSTGETGLLKKCINQCFNAYLGEILKLSSAKLIIFLGVKVKQYIKSKYMSNFETIENKIYEINIDGNLKKILFLPSQSNANTRQEKRIIKILTYEKITYLQNMLL